jgi:hypothetical protein
MQVDFLNFHIAISEIEALQTEQTNVIRYHDRRSLNAGAFKDIIGNYAEK